MWKACICRCQDFSKGQTELKPWDSNFSEGLRKLVFMALVYVIVGDKQVRWFSAEINSSRVGVCFGFGHFCQMALSDCFACLLKPHTCTFCSHLKRSLLDQDALVCQWAVLHNFSGALFSMIKHAQDWHDSWKIMPGKLGKEQEGRFGCHSGYCTAELGLYWLTWGRADFSFWCSSSWATQKATTGGPPCPHQWLVMTPVPARPPLLSTLHRASSFVDALRIQQLAAAGWSLQLLRHCISLSSTETARICPRSWDSKIWFCLCCCESLIFSWGLFLQISEWACYYIIIQGELANSYSY